MADVTSNGSSPVSPKRATWIHQIGYVTTAIVALQGAALGSYLIFDWVQRQDPRFYSGTNEHELRKEGEHWVRGSAIRSLAFVPGGKALSGDGVRLAVMPSFSDWYAVAISARPGSKRATGIIVRLQQPIYSRDDAGTPPIEISRVSFAVPLKDYREFTAWFDQHVDGYDGDGSGCLDGAPVAFERIDGKSTVSGIGNCESHYEEIKMRSLAFLKRYVPVSTLPADANWHVRE